MRVGGRTLVEISAFTVDEAREFFAGLELTGAAREIAAEVRKEIGGRLDFLAAVGGPAGARPAAGTASKRPAARSALR